MASLTSALQALPRAGDLREAAGQRLHQPPEGRIRHHHHLLAVSLAQERPQHLIGRLGLGQGQGGRGTGSDERLLKTRAAPGEGSKGLKRSRRGFNRKGGYLAVEEVVVKHVVEAELILAVELSVPEMRNVSMNRLWLDTHYRKYW